MQAGFLDDMAPLAAGDLELDVLVHSQHLDRLIQLARHLPELRIVVDHIALMPIDGQALEPAWVERYQQLAECPNIHMKVSALMEQSVGAPSAGRRGLLSAHAGGVVGVLWRGPGSSLAATGRCWRVRASSLLPCASSESFSPEGPGSVRKVLLAECQAGLQVELDRLPC